MFKTIAMLAVSATVVCAAPAMAQNGAEGSIERGLAARVVALTTPDIEKQLLDHVGQISAELGLADVDADAARWFGKNAGPLMIPHMRTLMADIERLYAETLTRQELQAMVDFYQTPMGRSIARKQVDLGLQMGEPISRMQSAYITDLLDSYCRDNDCGDAAPAGAANKSTSR